MYDGPPRPSLPTESEYVSLTAKLTLREVWQQPRNEHSTSETTASEGHRTVFSCIDSVIDLLSNQETS